MNRLSFPGASTFAQSGKFVLCMWAISCACMNEDEGKLHTADQCAPWRNPEKIKASSINRFMFHAFIFPSPNA